MGQGFTSVGYDEAMDNWVGRYIRTRSVEVLFSLSRPGDRVLDMGCGTGVEARAMADAGRIVSGFDPSPSMVEAARAAAPKASISQGSFSDLGEMAREHCWAGMALVYSSLGPLNCVRDLRSPLHEASAVLKDGGRMVVSTMNRFPAIEMAGSVASMKWRRARERTRRVQTVRVGDGEVEAYYHTVGEIRSSLPDGSKIVSVRALPLLLPPLRTASKDGPSIASLLQGTDRVLSPIWPFNRVGDHLQVVIEKGHTG